MLRAPRLAVSLAVLVATGGCEDPPAPPEHIERFDIADALVPDAPDGAAGDSAAADAADAQEDGGWSPGEVGTEFVQISAGLEHSCGVLESGYVACWGGNFWGALGDGTTISRRAPVLVQGITTAVEVAAGSRFSCVRLEDGTARCWGVNSQSTLGDGTRELSLLPVEVVDLHDVENLTTGDSHACAVLTDGRVFCWGEGYLGDGTGFSSSRPIEVSSLDDAVDVAAGDYETCVVRAGGSVVCWGGWFNPALEPTEVSGVDDAVEITAGGGFFCVRRTDRTVWCWGQNYEGQLGDGTQTYRETPGPVTGIAGCVSVSASARSHHSCAVLDPGEVRCWGSNDNGRLGDGTYARSSTPVAVAGISSATSVAVGESHTCALLDSGDVWCWGSNVHGQLGDASERALQPVVVSGIANATAVALGFGHACALVNGGVSCWGSNYSGTLGDDTGLPSAVARAVPGLEDVVHVAASWSATCATDSSGGAQCWGPALTPIEGVDEIVDANDGYAVTASGEVYDPYSAAIFEGIDDARSLFVGGSHRCVLRASGHVECWGGGEYLGNGGSSGLATTPVEVSGLSDAIALGGGASHTCALRSGGRIACWGSNINGQLGDGTFTPGYSPVEVDGITDAVAIGPGGGNHTCAVRGDGSVVCWGENGLGQLGDEIARHESCAWPPVEDCSTWPVAVSSLIDVLAVSTGGSSSCALRTTGEVVCWGASPEGQLGNGELWMSATATLVAPVEAP